MNIKEVIIKREGYTISLTVDSDMCNRWDAILLDCISLMKAHTFNQSELSILQSRLLNGDDFDTEEEEQENACGECTGCDEDEDSSFVGLCEELPFPTKCSKCWITICQYNPIRRFP